MNLTSFLNLLAGIAAPLPNLAKAKHTVIGFQLVTPMGLIEGAAAELLQSAALVVSHNGRIRAASLAAPRFLTPYLLAPADHFEIDVGTTDLHVFLSLPGMSGRDVDWRFIAIMEDGLTFSVPVRFS